MRSVDSEKARNAPIMYKRAVSKIDDPENPEHQRKPGCNDKQEHPLTQAIDEHEDEVLDCHGFAPNEWSPIKGICGQAGPSAAKSLRRTGHEETLFFLRSEFLYFFYRKPYFFSGNFHHVFQDQKILVLWILGCGSHINTNVCHVVFGTYEALTTKRIEF